MKKNFYIILILFVFIIQFATLSFCDDIDEETINVNSEIQSSSNLLTGNIKPPDINSRAYVVIDRNSNTIIYGKNENVKRKMASTTKIMTATVIIEHCDLKDTIEVSKKAASTGGSRLGLKNGDKITVSDLLYGLMLCSGNDCAVALAEYCSGSIDEFSKLMNEKAKELGLNNSHFVTPHGLDAEQHYTTAYELASLSNYALNNSIFRNIVGTKSYTVTINGLPKNISNTNELLGNLNGIYGIKTGFTNGANRCLVTACKRDDMDIICVVLGADTKKFRTSDSIKLIEYTFQNFKLVNIQNIINSEFETWKKENSNKFYINKGLTNDINLYLENIDNPVIPLRKDLVDSISVSIDCQKIFESPLLKDTQIGNIIVSTNESIILPCKIYNDTKIEKKNVYHYLFEIYRSYQQLLENILI